MLTLLLFLFLTSFMLLYLLPLAAQPLLPLTSSQARTSMPVTFLLYHYKSTLYKDANEGISKSSEGKRSDERFKCFERVRHWTFKGHKIWGKLGSPSSVQNNSPLLKHQVCHRDWDLHSFLEKKGVDKVDVLEREKWTVEISKNCWRLFREGSLYHKSSYTYYDLNCSLKSIPWPLFRMFGGPKGEVLYLSWACARSIK